MNVLYVLVEDIKNNLKLFKNTHVFETEYFGENLLRPQRMVAELRLTDPLPELAVGGVLELELGASRSESYFFESSRPCPFLLRVGWSLSLPLALCEVSVYLLCQVQIWIVVSFFGNVQLLQGDCWQFLPYVP